jgi:hypothetical protein
LLAPPAGAYAGLRERPRAALAMIAWVGVASGILATIVSAVLAVRQTRMAERLARVNADLDAEVNRRSALFERELRAEAVLMQYREPLAAAAFDLQSRLYNILELDFFEKFGAGHARRELAETTTLFRMAQFFGWTEILRREIQFLSFPDDSETTRVIELQGKIASAFLTSNQGEVLMVWGDEQRAIGERMIVEEHDKILCMGYARFRDEYEARFAADCEQLRAEFQQAGAEARLRELQHLLCDLVETLDTRRVRYTRDLERA